LLLAAVSLAPFVGSLLLYYFWKPQSFTNYGDLLPVTSLADVSIAQGSGAAFRFAELRGKWIFLMVDSGACDEYCQSKLYLMRQIRLTQGKDQERIERLWIITDGRQPAPELATSYAGTRRVFAAGTNFEAKLPAAASARDHVYVVDAFGNLMMRFPRDPDLPKVKRDISRLMKVSSGWVQSR
jgi:hypothetical protein